MGINNATASTAAAWNAWKLPNPLVYHIYGLNSCVVERIPWISSSASADAMQRI